MAIIILTRLFITQGFIFLILKTGDTLEACELWNAALCKPAEMIDMHQGFRSPMNAVDGDRTKTRLSGSCVSTLISNNTWWVVDLMNEYFVEIVVITNRGETFSGRLKDVFIDLFDSNPNLDPSFPQNTNGIHCTNWTTAFSGKKSFDCQRPSYARYVKLYKAHYGILNFCEFEVMVSHKRGEPYCSSPISKYFEMRKDSTVDINKYGVLSTHTTNTALMCMLLCAKEGGCTGLLWTEDRRECQMLDVLFGKVKQFDNQVGTDFYVMGFCLHGLG